jgi:hypothetical protein
MPPVREACEFFRPPELYDFRIRRQCGTNDGRLRTVSEIDCESIAIDVSVNPDYSALAATGGFPSYPFTLWIEPVAVDFGFNAFAGGIATLMNDRRGRARHRRLRFHGSASLSIVRRQPLAAAAASNVSRVRAKPDSTQRFSSR